MEFIVCLECVTELGKIIGSRRGLKYNKNAFWREYRTCVLVSSIIPAPSYFHAYRGFHLNCINVQGTVLYWGSELDPWK